MSKRTQAVCKSWSVKKGWGFLRNPAGDAAPDVFVHYTHIEGEGFKALSEGELVEFDLHVDHNSRPQAHGVTRLGKPGGTISAVGGGAKKDGRANGGMARGPAGGGPAGGQRKKPDGQGRAQQHAGAGGPPRGPGGKGKGKGRPDVGGPEMPLFAGGVPAEFAGYPPGGALPPYAYSAAALPAIMSALYDPALSGQILGALRPMSALYGAPDGLHGGGSPTAGMPANAMAGYPAMLPPGYAAARPR